jgi:hypothetical protein
MSKGRIVWFIIWALIVLAAVFLGGAILAIFPLIVLGVIEFIRFFAGSTRSIGGKILRSAIVIVVVVVGAVLFFEFGTGGGQSGSPRPDFMLGNGTGSNITEIQIRPSKQTYSDTDLALSFVDISLPDQQGFAVILPNEWKDIYYFDIAVKYKDGRGNAKTNERVHIDRGGKMPLLVMHIGNNSTIPLVAGGGTATVAAGGIIATAAAVYSGAIVLTASTGALVTGVTGITTGLAAIGVVVGGVMATGIGIVLALPIVLGVTIFAITSWLSTDRLVVTQISY